MKNRLEILKKYAEKCLFGGDFNYAEGLLTIREIMLLNLKREIKIAKDNPQKLKKLLIEIEKLCLLEVKQEIRTALEVKEDTT